MFKIADHFDAVLLSDEADTFMERPTSYHDTHNRIVTIFLRRSEYYQGVLFLPPNRGVQFNDVIISRIHLAIEYDLTWEVRRQIWTNLLLKAQTIQEPATVGGRVSGSKRA
ncbi:ATPase AAA-type core [Penicillium chrysogenum]|nr:ATPase AAA-type core [Penicillium chrysogenum]